jgi:hypothetical protein
MGHTTRWAQRVFGGAQLGDARRTARLVRVAARAAESPAGKVTEVFREPAERQGSYDLLENVAVAAAELTEALGRSTAHACSDFERVLVVLDGTSLTVTDADQSKGLGRIGPFSSGASGVKLMNAVALTDGGRPVGVADQIWWTRLERAPGGYRKVDERESVHWREAVKRIGGRFSTHAPDTKLHFLADREADAALLMRAISSAGHEFTIRSNGNRKVLGRRGPAGIRASLSQRPPIATMSVTVPAKQGRPARAVELAVRAARLDVRMRDHHVQETRIVSLTYVWALERGKPRGLDWMLVTNTEVLDAEAACETVRRYTKRWRIEDFHRTWKSGLCRVEETQLRSASAIIKWATILAAVASRAEELKHRARETPDEPAETIFSDEEIRALVTLKQQIKRRTDVVTPVGLTVAQAVRWLADLGGYVGNKRSGPPGAITIGRGLERLDFAVVLIAHLRDTGQMR